MKTDIKKFYDKYHKEIDIEKFIFNFDDPNLKLNKVIFWRNSKLGIKDALINSIQLELIDNIYYIMDLYGNDFVWDLLPIIKPYFEVGPFSNRYYTCRNYIAAKINKDEGDLELSDFFYKKLEEEKSKNMNTGYIFT